MVWLTNMWQSHQAHTLHKYTHHQPQDETAKQIQIIKLFSDILAHACVCVGGIVGVAGGDAKKSNQS